MRGFPWMSAMLPPEKSGLHLLISLGWTGSSAKKQSSWKRGEQGRKKEKKKTP